MRCYIDYLDSKNNYEPTRKDFDSFEDAMHFMIESFDTVNSDFINYY
jgi:hypothetical protein